MKKTFLMLAALFSGLAHAHITFEQPAAPAGSSYRATFKVGHGCDGAATTTCQARGFYSGANVYANTTSLFLGNSTSNVLITTTSVSTGNVNVGIYTASASYPLDVSGTARIKRTFSNTVSLGKMFVLWNDRPIPAPQILCAAMPVMSEPAGTSSDCSESS